MPPGTRFKQKKKKDSSQAATSDAVSYFLLKLLCGRLGKTYVLVVLNKLTQQNLGIAYEINWEFSKAH